MGVTYSLSSELKEDSKELSPQLEYLRVSYDDADRLINAFYLHQFQPVMEAEGLQVSEEFFYAVNLNDYECSCNTVLAVPM